MHYLIYIPGAAQKSRDVLGSVGLSALTPLGTPEPHFAPIGEVGAGPDGGHGMLILPFFDKAGAATNPPVAYLPEAQTWVQHPTENYWLGYWPDQPPTPADLCRSNPVPYLGSTWTLDDGQAWIIPKTFAQEATIKLGNDGRPAKQYRYTHEDLYAIGLPILEALQAQMDFEHRAGRGELEEGETDPWDFARGYEFLCYCLSLNYRLNDFMIGELGLLREDQLFPLMVHATDVEKLHRLQNELEKGN